MFKWINKLRQIVRGYDEDRLRMARAMEQLEKLVRDRTDIAVDVNAAGGSYAIVVGRYRGADYVQTFHFHDRDLGELIAQMRNMERFANVGRVDAPPGIRAVVKHALKNGLKSNV